MKKIVIFISLFTLLIPFYGCSHREDGNGAHKIIATVNGEAITSDELQYITGKLKAQVMNDFLEKYSVPYTQDFWTINFEGKTPSQALHEQAFEKCVMAKLQFVLMREKGIYTDISYKGLYDKAAAFNKQNSGKQGAVGLKSIKLEQFYSYYLDNGIMELRNILAKNEIKPTPGEIKNCMQELKSTVQYADTTELESIAVSKLVNEKYDRYIAKIRKAAEIEYKR